MPVTIRKPSLQQPLIDNFTDEQLITFSNCPYCDDSFYKSTSARDGKFLEKQYLYHCRLHINSESEKFSSLLILPSNLISQASRILSKLNLTVAEQDQYGK